MRLLVATDAWRPQVNGVVRSLEAMVAQAPAFGVELSVLSPAAFRSVPLPTYGEIRLSVVGPGEVARRLAAAAPTHVHIATEGPIGWATRQACLREGRAFTTSYHTRFPEYLAARLPVPEAWSYAALRRFHAAARATLVSTPSLEEELRRRGFSNLLRWTRGVDTDLFRPRSSAATALPRPISSAWAGSPSRRTSRRSLPSTCRAPRWWWGMAPPAGASLRATRMRGFSGRNPARAWPGSMPTPTFSCSRA